MKYFFKRDTLLATVSVFVLIYLLHFIGFNTHIFDPMKIAFSEIKFSDLAFSVFKEHKKNGVDKKIIIVDIGKTGRDTIAAVIQKIGNNSPGAIGVDVLFDGPREPAEGDSALRIAIGSANNIVLAERLNGVTENIFGSEEPNFFQTAGKPSGYVNFIGEEGDVIRYYLPGEKEEAGVHLSFTSELVRLADPERFAALQKKNGKPLLINFRRDESQFFRISYRELLSNAVADSLLKDKIVLIGYAPDDPYDIEDKFFTPLNEKFAGKALPDMNGVIIHANILSMILDNVCIRKVPDIIMYVLAFVITWLHMALFIKYYADRQKHKWFHLVAKTAQLLSAVFFIYIGIILLVSGLRIQADFTFTAAAVALAIDVLYFYEGFARWLHAKYKFNTIFSGEHH
jgi:CHASE2 domain-containing sensor protein